MIKTILIAGIRAYRFLLSPWLGNACRYWPTCSDYSMQAIEAYGAVRGGWMTLVRLARCHPYAAGGVDPVPLQFSWRCWCRSNTDARNRAPLSLTSVKSGHEH
jgi:putative membrane protein insertion efficiency factor